MSSPADSTVVLLLTKVLMCVPDRKTQCAHNAQFTLSNPKQLTKTNSHNGSVSHHISPWRDIAGVEELFSDKTGTQNNCFHYAADNYVWRT